MLPVILYLLSIALIILAIVLSYVRERFLDIANRSWVWATIQIAEDRADDAYRFSLIALFIGMILLVAAVLTR